MSGPGGWSHGGPDRVTRVSYHRRAGFFEQVGNSVCGAVFGVVLIIAACPLLFWNEVSSFRFGFFLLVLGCHGAGLGELQLGLSHEQGYHFVCSFSDLRPDLGACKINLGDSMKLASRKCAFANPSST